MSNKVSLQNQLQNPCARNPEESNEVFDRVIRGWYCSIIVVNHWLITIIRFIAKSYIYPWKNFINRLHLVLRTYKIFLWKTCALESSAIQTGPWYGQKQQPIPAACTAWAHFERAIHEQHLHSLYIILSTVFSILYVRIGWHGFLSRLLIHPHNTCSKSN